MAELISVTLYSLFEGLGQYEFYAQNSSIHYELI